MEGPAITVTTKSIFGYTLFFIGLILLVYVIAQCILLANGTFEPLRLEWERLPSEEQALYGLILQLGMFGLLVAVASILLKAGFKVAKT